MTPNRHGFVLLENLIGILLVSILAIGMFALLTLTDQQSRRSIWQQKAVLVLHGHMEKIASLYRFGEIQNQTMSVFAQTRGYPAGHQTPEGDHVILTSPSDPYRLVETDRQRFLNTADNEGVIYHYAPAGGLAGSAADRNLVWLDKGQKIIGMLSWTTDTTVLPQPCYDGVTPGTPCPLVTLYLDFPYRLHDTEAPIPLARPITFALRTLAGAR